VSVLLLFLPLLFLKEFFSPHLQPLEVPQAEGNVRLLLVMFSQVVSDEFLFLCGECVTLVELNELNSILLFMKLG